MKVHELKILSSFMDAVISGDKTFELRENTDRKFQVGDRLLLKEWDAILCVYKCRQVMVKVTYLLDQVKFGLMPNFCAMAIRRVYE